MAKKRVQEAWGFGSAAVGLCIPLGLVSRARASTVWHLMKPRLPTIWLVLPVVLAAGCSAPSKLQDVRAQVVSFDACEVGQLPPGFTTALTGGGGPISWVVREDAGAPGGKKVLVQESADDTSYRFPLCIYDKTIARDVSVEVKYKAIAGKVDQAGGVVLRYSPENFYVARANALEDNIDLFKTVNGKRLKVAEAPVKVTGGEWHTLRFDAEGPHLVVAFDGKVVIRTDDTTFAGPGKVGLWTKADSVSAFSGLSIKTANGDSGAARPTEAAAPASDLNAEFAQAAARKKPIVVFVVESGKSDADSEVRSFLDAPKVKAALAGMTPILVDLKVSRNRAVVAHLRVPDTPVLLCLSSRGVIASRDTKALTQDLVLKRIGELERQGPELDAKLGSLEAALAANPGDAKKQLDVADFLRAHENAREAVPHLAAVVQAATADAALRVRAWVDLARAHLWIAEPEKARREANDLLTALGPTVPTARAGGNLVLGIQDTNGKRFALARREFDEAVRAAPDSIYGKEASEELAKLPKEGK